MDFISAASMYRTVNIDGVLRTFQDRRNQLELAKYFPLRFYNKDKIEMDVDVPYLSGQTPLSSRDASAPIYNPTFGRSKREMEVPVWKEKVIFASHELYDLRELGTYDQLTTMQRLVAQKVGRMERRLQMRLENLCRDVLFEQRIVAANAQGVPTEYVYPMHPADFRPNASVTWDTIATADPIDDLQLWAEQFRRRSEYLVDEVVMPIGTFRQLQQITKFRTIMNNNFGDFRGDTRAITNMMTSFLGVGNIRESEGTMSSTVPILVAATTATDTVTIQDLSMLEVGQEVILHRVSDSVEHIYTVASINAANNQVTLDRNLDAGVSRGDIFAFHRYNIPADKILIVGRSRWQPDSLGQQAAPTVGGEAWAEVSSVRNLDHDMQDPVTGIYRKTIDKTKDDPSHLEDLLGLNAIPRVTYGRGWMVATIY